MEAGVANHVWELEEIVGLADWNLPSPKALGVGWASWDETRPPSEGRLVVGQADQERLFLADSQSQQGYVDRSGPYGRQHRPEEER